MAQITHLQNGNVIYNDKETEFYNLPRPLLFQIFAEETGRIDDFGGGLSRDDTDAINLFIADAERNGYTFPQIPPKEFFLRREEQTRYYKFGEPFQRTIKRKHEITADDNRVLQLTYVFLTHYGIMSEKEARNLTEGWRKKITEIEETHEITVREPLKDTKGKLVVDWSQQTTQDKKNRVVRAFYDWLDKYVKKWHSFNDFFFLFIGGGIIHPFFIVKSNLRAT